MPNQVTMQEWTILTFIRNYWQTHKFSPSVLEITHGCGMRNRYVAYRLLKRMAAKNLLNFGGVHRIRSIVVRKVAVAVIP